MTQTQKTYHLVPKWIIFISGLLALLELLVSLSLFFAPESVAENVDLKAKGVDYLMQTWAIRQFALGIIFAVATFKRSAQMLFISFLFFSVLMFGDVWIGITQHNWGLSVIAGIFAVFSSFILFYLKKNLLKV